MTDLQGQRRALLNFNLLAIIGYLMYQFSNNWPLFLVGTLFVAAWSSMSLPATFALIGESLAKGHRAIGFSMQSIIKRVPIVIAPGRGGRSLLPNSWSLRGGRAAVRSRIVAPFTDSDLCRGILV